MRIKPQTTIFIAVLIFACGIFATSALGVWKTEGDKTPSKFSEKQFSESYNPADIRGSYTFTNISRFFNIPPEDLFTAFGIDSALNPEFKCKDLETIYENTANEIGTSSVKLFTAYYCGLPYEMTEEVYLPESAVKVLFERAALTPEQQAYLQSHTVLV